MSKTRTFSVAAVLTVYQGVVAHGDGVYRESLDLLEYLMRPVHTSVILHGFGNERVIEVLHTQFPRLHGIAPFDLNRKAMSLERWTTAATHILGADSLEVAAPA